MALNWLPLDWVGPGLDLNTPGLYRGTIFVLRSVLARFRIGLVQYPRRTVFFTCGKIQQQVHVFPTKTVLVCSFSWNWLTAIVCFVGFSCGLWMEFQRSYIMDKVCMNTKWAWWAQWTQNEHKMLGGVCVKPDMIARTLVSFYNASRTQVHRALVYIYQTSLLKTCDKQTHIGMRLLLCAKACGRARLLA